MKRMEEFGRVVEVSGRVAKVEFTSKETCANCRARIVCHFAPGDKVFTEASNGVGAKVGDLVRVEVDPKRSIFTGLLIFIFPILAFIIVFLAVRGAVQSEGYGIVGAVASLVIYFLFLKKLESWFAKRGSFSPIVREIIEQANS